MSLKIFTTGLEQYAPGGQARLKVLCVGGPGVGKTRWASYWPKPIYADCEAGLASVADRKAHAVSISTSQDMLDFLHEMKLECQKPPHLRRFLTVVIDTLDAFQRKVQDEFLQQNPGMQSFRGYDAWGYLDSKMQMLMTRLLNLDMNVVVNVHYKDRTVSEGTGDAAQERLVTELQLKGDIRSTAFNDFDLVGWMGTYYEAVDGQRVKKRGITFVDTPERPFLKDRLHITPPWLEVTFSEDDYGNLFSLYVKKMEALEQAELVEPPQDFGEIESGVAAPTPGGNVAAAGIVGPLAGGPLPAVDPKDVPLEQHDKPTLQKMARELGLKYQANTIKAELIDMLIAKRKEMKAEVEAAATQTEKTLAAEAPKPKSDATPASPAPAEPAPVVEDPPAASASPSDGSTSVQPSFIQPEAPSASAPVTASEQPELGLAPDEQVDPATGEIAPVTHEQAVQNVEDVLGGTVVSDVPAADVGGTAAEQPVAAPKAAAPAPAPASAEAPVSGPAVCDEEGCTVDLSTQNVDWVRLSYIKWRKHLCDQHYLVRKNAA